jgi:tetratricopeptide (TPR) repeat protein
MRERPSGDAVARETLSWGLRWNRTWWLLGAMAVYGACGSDPIRECNALLAAEKYQAAVARCEQVFEKTGDPRAGVAAAQAHQGLGHGDAVLAWAKRLRNTSEEAGVLRLASRVYRKRGIPDLAAEASRRELFLRRKAGDHEGAADSTYSLFFLAWGKGSYGEALDFARQSFEEAEKAQDRKREARALQSLQMAVYEAGDFDRARGLLEAASALVRPEERSDRARLLVYEGLIRLNTGRVALARDAFERGLQLAVGNPDRTFLRSTHLNLVKTYLTLGDVERAAQHLEAAWQNADPTGRKPYALLSYRARVLHARGRYAEAAEVLKTALGKEPDPAWMQDLEYQRGVVEEARGNARSAEEAYEHSVAAVETLRAALGPDELKSWLMDDKRPPFEALFRLQARSGRTREALATVERAKAGTFLEAFLHASSAPAGETGGAEIARAAGQRLETITALLPPLNASPVVALRPIDEALALLGGRRLLVYFEADNELWRIDVAGPGVEAKRLPASLAMVRDLVHRFIARPDDPGTAARLGEILLPANAQAKPGSTLSIVADGVLGNLPFAALRRGGRYLVEDHAIAYVPSINVMAALEGRPPAGYGASVVIADSRRDLPEAALEAKDVAARLHVTPQIAGAATLERLRQASRADVLHLATHTGLGPRGPWLALADGEVSAERIVTWKVAPRLVVLATCASAARRGKGMWGSLGSAFLVAGSRTVLASLWSVQDRTAREMVLGFYEQGGARDPAGALARAQRARIAQGRGPSNWAPFVVLGSDQPPREAQ